MYISVDGGMLVQSNDDKFADEIKVVTKLKPSDAELKDLLFAMRVVKFVKSNAIVVAKDGVAIGIGGGQVNRI
jgi:phosphoribosylaminoimidazolecarboxamide formyltransferase/IMP cyclohydrolase